MVGQSITRNGTRDPPQEGVRRTLVGGAERIPPMLTPEARRPQPFGRGRLDRRLSPPVCSAHHNHYDAASNTLLRSTQRAARSPANPPGVAKATPGFLLAECGRVSILSRRSYPDGIPPRGFVSPGAGRTRRRDTPPRSRTGCTVAGAEPRQPWPLQKQGSFPRTSGLVGRWLTHNRESGSNSESGPPERRCDLDAEFVDLTLSSPRSSQPSSSGRERSRGFPFVSLEMKKRRER